MEVPKALRSTVGKPRFVQSLETESLTVAERRVHSVIAGWKHLIHNLNSSGGLEATIANLEADRLQKLKKGLEDYEIKIQHEDLAWEFEDSTILEATKIMTGEWVKLDRHIEDFLRDSVAEPKTKDMQRNDLRRLAKAFPYTSDVTKKKLSEWVKVELMGNLGLSVTTCRRHLSSCRVYWKWLEENKGIEQPNPFLGVLPASKRKSKDDVRNKRKGFTLKDYQNLLCKAIVVDPQLSDLIRLGAYTGCRIEELCALKLLNVREGSFQIEDAKTEAGWRVVPIHQHIKATVESLVAASDDGYLLSGLTFNKYGDRSNAIGKRFGRLKAKCGYGPDFVFHSFRKGVATQLETAGVPENYVARLLGHELKTMSYGLYSGGVALPVLSEAISHLDWGGDMPM